MADAAELAEDEPSPIELLGRSVEHGVERRERQEAPRSGHAEPEDLGADRRRRGALEHPIRDEDVVVERQRGHQDQQAEGTADEQAATARPGQAPGAAGASAEQGDPAEQGDREAELHDLAQQVHALLN